MRLAPILALAGTVACGDRSPQVAAPSSASAPLELAITEWDGSEQAVRWTAQLEIPEPKEDDGIVAYARHKTVLRVDDVVVGWLEPGARVGVASVTGDRALVVLFAWSASGGGGGKVRAWVDARDLGPAPPRDAPPFGRATHPERLIKRGESIRRLDGAPLASTFCGDVEVIGEDARGLHAVQREDGVVLEGLLPGHPMWEKRACPGLLVLESGGGKLLAVYHERVRRYRGAALPPELVERGPFEGPPFAQLVAKRARIYWLVDDRKAGPTCQEWQLVPPAPGSDAGEMVSRARQGDGDTLVTRYSMMSYGAEVETSVLLLGPSMEYVAPPGRQPHSNGFALGCGAWYRVIASAGGVITMYTDPPDVNGRIRAYDPRDAERWYTDRARCERDAEARRQRVALAAEPHHGC